MQHQQCQNRLPSPHSMKGLAIRVTYRGISIPGNLFGIAANAIKLSVQKPSICTSSGNKCTRSLFMQAQKAGPWHQPLLVTLWYLILKPSVMLSVFTEARRRHAADCTALSLCLFCWTSRQEASSTLLLSSPQETCLSALKTLWDSRTCTAGLWQMDQRSALASRVANVAGCGRVLQRRCRRERRQIQGALQVCD